MSKDTAAPWLQRLPNHWTVIRIRRTIEFAKNGVWGDEPNGHDDIACVRVADFDRVRLRITEQVPTVRAVATSERIGRILKKGDLLLEKSGGGEQQPVGAVVQYDRPEDAVCSNFVARVVTRKTFHSRFLVYVHAHLYESRVNVRSIKQTTGIQNLDAYSYFSELIPEPPLDEQHAIADFLDRKTAQIDALVAKKERLIELLKKKRQATISQAVTKGLDPNVPMKPSGIAWLGDVPKHWEEKEARYLFRQSSISPEDEDQIVTCFRDGQVTLRENRRSDGFMVALQEVGYQHVRKGQVVIHSMDGFAGAIGVSDSSGKCTPEYVVLDPTSSCVVPDYYGVCLREMAHQGFIEVACKAVRERAPRLRFATFRRFLLPVPPKDEQIQIASRVLRTKHEYLKKIELLEKSVSVLKRYRSAIITAAVTGQIEVRTYKGGPPCQ